MLDVDLVRAAYDEQMRPAEATGLPPGVYAESDGLITRIVGQHRGLISAPADLLMDGPALDALIGRQRDFFAARDEPVEWNIRSHDQPADIGQRLRAAGFAAEETGHLVVGLAQDAVQRDASMPAEVTIRRTAADDDMRAIAAMETQVWGADWDWLADDLTQWSQGDSDQFAVFVAQASGQVVAAAWMVCKPGTEFAGLWGGSTLASWRGRGIYRALVACRARLAVDRGVRYLHVQASSNSRLILERLGFVAIATTTNYLWSPSS
ncbi:MAG: GNAT family N-acetyltransferase [Streptosporangiaceae bacterium]